MHTGETNEFEKPGFITNLQDGTQLLIKQAAEQTNTPYWIEILARDSSGNILDDSYGFYSNEQDLTRFWRAYEELKASIGFLQC